MKPALATTAQALPVTLLGGYLGAGKTTLVNHLLRAASGRRIAVLVNDFGDLGIDGDLIEAREEDVISLAGGCICCSFGGDLMAALLRVRDRAASLDHVLIETSGVALPASVARALQLVKGLRLNAVVVLADAGAIQQQAANGYVGETVRHQLQQADLLVLNKLDLLPSPPSPSLGPWVAQQAPQAFVLEATRGQVSPELLFDMPIPRGDFARRHEAGAAERPLDLRAGAHGIFRSISFAFAGAVDVDALERALIAHPDRIVRAKGLLRGADGTVVQLQLSGARCITTPWKGKPFATGRLVCIGPAAIWNETVLRALVWRHAMPNTHPAPAAAGQRA